MSKNVDKTWAYYISGRNIHLYQLSHDSGDNDASYQIRIPEFEDSVKLVYPKETISNGLMFEGTAFIEPFVTADPNELRAKAIDRSRIKSAMRYHEKGGPTKRYGAKTKKQENVMSRTEIRRRGL